MLETEMEDLLWMWPDRFLEPLKQFRRQPRSAVGRADLVFEDPRGTLLVVEIKRGTLGRGAIGQVHDYFGMMKHEFPNKSVEMMVIANSIPEQRKVALRLYNIEDREISDKRFRDVALEMGYVFQSEQGSTACVAGTPSIITPESDKKVTIAGETLPELNAVVNAYDLTAELGMRVHPIKAEYYRQIWPPEWKGSHPHYEFYQTRGKIGAELHIRNSPKAVSITEFLKPFHGRAVANGNGVLTWNSPPEMHRHSKGFLAAFFPLTSSPETVAAGMRDLISMTRSGVSERL